jgi:serine/threonine protein phosphatase PrpC
LVNTLCLYKQLFCLANTCSLYIFKNYLFLNYPLLVQVANAGDSRCVLCKKDGRSVALSNDHKPTDEPEFQRLQKEGFNVVRGRIYDTATGVGGLNLSRAIGDFHYRQGVPSRPEVKHKNNYFVFVSYIEQVVRRGLASDDALVVLGTDGLYDVLSNAEVCRLALSVFCLFFFFL